MDDICIKVLYQIVWKNKKWTYISYKPLILGLKNWMHEYYKSSKLISIKLTIFNI